jgi:hypothetical protein
VINAPNRLVLANYVKVDMVGSYRLEPTFEPWDEWRYLPRYPLSLAHWAETPF